MLDLSHSLAGSYIVAFPHQGTYFYAGTPIANNVVLSGRVEVLKPAQKAYKVMLSLGGIEAEFVPDGAGTSRPLVLAKHPTAKPHSIAISYTTTGCFFLCKISTEYTDFIQVIHKVVANDTNTIYTAYSAFHSTSLQLFMNSESR